MAVKTTKIQCNQDVDLRGKADIEGKVTCGSDVEVDGKLTINSAKDLKTKDGSSIGGSDTSPWKVIPVYEMWGFENTNDGTNTYYGISGDSFVYIAENTSQDNPIDFQVGFTPLGGITPSIGIYSFTNNISDITSKITVPDDFVTKSQVINLGDINKKQSTLYRHTVIIDNNSLKAKLSFMTESEKNTKVNSIQDLIAVFGNTTLGVSGYAHYDTFGYVLLTLEVGKDITTTKVGFIETGAGESIEVLFSDIFGTDGFIITDIVTAM